MKKTRKLAMAEQVVETKPEPTLEEKIAEEHQAIFFIFDFTLRSCNRIRKEFFECAERDLVYELRNSEKVMLSEIQANMTRRLKDAYDKSLATGTAGLKLLLDWVKEEQEDALQSLIDSPYRHNSTSALSNFHQECELRAKAEFWNKNGRYGGSFANQFLKHLGSLVQLLEEKEAKLAKETFHATNQV
jgi:hypothetical protein